MTESPAIYSLSFSKSAWNAWRFTLTPPTHFHNMMSRV